MQKLRGIWKAKKDSLFNFLAKFNVGNKIWPFYSTKKKNKSDFSLSSGIWKDYEIDASQIRTQAWKRK